MCQVNSCGKPPVKKGLCNAHYLRMRRHGDPEGGEMMRVIGEFTSPHEAFRARLGDPQFTDDCHEWTGSRETLGYGSVHWGGKHHRASRLSFEVFHRPLEDGEHVLHSCANPPCVNPRHLRAGGHRDNMQDMAQHGHSRRGEKNPFVKLTEADVLSIRAREGVPSRVVAEEFGVSQVTINEIRRGKTWRHLL